MTRIKSHFCTSRRYFFSTIKSVSLTFFSAAIILSGNTGWADSMTINDLSSQPNLSVVNITFSGNTYDSYAGTILGTLNGNSTTFFCYDLNHNITPGSYAVTVLSPTTSNLNTIASSGNYMLPPVSNTGWSSIQVATAFLNSLNLSTITTVDQSTALQLAVWTIIYDWTQGNTPNLPTGTFTANNLSGNLSALLTNYLNLAQAFASGQNLNFGNWNIILSGPSNSPNQVLIGLAAPEPQTYLLLGSLLTVTICVAQRKRKLI